MRFNILDLRCSVIEAIATFGNNNERMDINALEKALSHFRQIWESDDFQGYIENYGKVALAVPRGVIKYETDNLYLFNTFFEFVSYGKLLSAIALMQDYQNVELLPTLSSIYSLIRFVDIQKQEIDKRYTH